MTFDELIAERVRPLAEALARGRLESLRVGYADFEIEMSRRSVGTPQARSQAEPQGAPTDGSPPDYDVLTSDVVGRVRFLRPAVAVGTLVESERELAFIETLGIRNPIRSRGSGRVAVVYVREGEAVDYGAPLFAIEKSP